MKIHSLGISHMHAKGKHVYISTFLYNFEVRALSDNSLIYPTYSADGVEITDCTRSDEI